MKIFTPSSFLAVMIIATQVLGPAGLWAAEQRGIRVEASRQIIVSGLKGDQLTLQRVSGPSPLQFRDVVPEDARVTTGVGTTAELLLSNRAVLTLGNSTTVQVRIGSADQTMIQVTTGAVRLSTAASALGSQGFVTVQTPTTQVQTRGGILRVAVDRPAGKAEHYPNGGQAYRASYMPELLLAAAPSSDLIQVEEGTAEIPGVGPTGELLTVQAGQRVMIQAGRAGVPTEAGSLGAETTGILATTSHAQTPKEGRDYLVTLQVDQATKLGQALTGAAETGQKDLDKKSDTKNVINGATGGVSLVTALFGSGNAANPTSGGITTDRSGAGYGVHNNQGNDGFFGVNGLEVKSNGSSKALLVFTRRDPIGVAYETVTADDFGNVRENKAIPDGSTKPSIRSSFTATKELVLIGGASNVGHGGAAPTERLVVRGLGSENIGIRPGDFVTKTADTKTLTSPAVANANSTFVVQTSSTQFGTDGALSHFFTGGTLGQFSSRGQSELDGNGESLGFLVVDGRVTTDAKGNTIGDQNGISYIDGAITATSSNVVLKGGVILDQQTTVTLGQTDATKSYLTATGGTFTGSLLSVIKEPIGFTKLTMQERMLGVYDGSIVKPDASVGGKALLSVLDAKLVGPSGNIPLIDIAAGTHFDRNGNPTSDVNVPDVTVTSAIVTRSTTTLPAPTSSLDPALLNASAPLVALTQAKMTTSSHFADLAGNATQSLNLNGALVALSAAQLFVSGNLLNLNNATAAITGYLFSLTNGSTLQINHGSLFSLNNGSSLTLNGNTNAFGVFGNGTSAKPFNTLTIDNNLCGTGTCGKLVDSAHNAFILNGVPIRVAGVSQDVVLPNGFAPFAGNQAAANVTISNTAGHTAALFQVDTGSHLTIHGVKVQ